MPQYVHELLKTTGDIQGDIKQINVQMTLFQENQAKQWQRHDEEVIKRVAENKELTKQINLAAGSINTLKYIAPALWLVTLSCVGYLVHEIINLHDVSIVSVHAIEGLQQQRIQASIPPGWDDLLNRFTAVENNVSEIMGSTKTIAAKKQVAPHINVISAPPTVIRQEIYQATPRSPGTIAPPPARFK